MSPITEFLRSFRRAPRALARTPAISIASVATLAIPLGATTAIFSVFYSVVMRPLPFRDPDGLVQLNARAEDGRLLGISQVELEDWASQVSSFESVALYGFSQFTLTDAGDPELLRGAVVSEEFFALLSAPIQLGRGLAADDGAAPNIVISDALWRVRFGGDPAVIGRSVRLNGQPYTIVGVAAATLRYPADDVSVWTGLRYARTSPPPQWSMRGFRQFSMIARLHDPAAITTAQHEVDEVARSLARSYPRFNHKVGAVLTPLRARLTDAVRRPLTLLLVAVTFVLFVACANLANLSLARAAASHRDMAVRTAIGASPGQLAAGALAESAVLALGGAVLGLAVARSAVAAMLQVIPPDLPRTAEIRLDIVSIGFTLAMTSVSLLLFGIGPAVWSARRSAHEALRSSMPSPAGLSRIRDAVVVAEIALAVVLLIGSALLGRSLYNLMQSGSGAENGGAVTVKLNLSGEGTMAPMMLADRLLAEMAATPGVQAVGVASSLPPNISQMRTSLVARDLTGADQDVTVEIVAASGGVFTALGVPVLAGRTFSDSDTTHSDRVVILSKTASERFFPDGDAVGRGLRVFASGGQPDSTVVGVVGDVKFAGMDAPPDGAIYVPHTQRSFRTQYLVVRAGGATGPAIQLIRKAVRRVDASLAVSDIRTVADLVTAATARPRFQSALLALFAFLALSLAGIGLYGVITHIVGHRAREFAVRLALGATPTDLLRLVLSKALVLSAIGAVIGTGLSLALGRAMASLLFGMSPIDAPSFIAAVALALAIGMAAAVGPAIRAARLQPSATLRST